MFLGNKPEVRCNTLLWAMRRERLNKYCLSIPLGDFVSYVSLLSLPGMSFYHFRGAVWPIIRSLVTGSEFEADQGDAADCRVGSVVVGRRQGLGSSALPRSARCQGGLSCCGEKAVGQAIPEWRGGREKKGETSVLHPSASPGMGRYKGDKSGDQTERGGGDICRDGRLRRLARRGW